AAERHLHLAVRLHRAVARAALVHGHFFGAQVFGIEVARAGGAGIELARGADDGDAARAHQAGLDPVDGAAAVHVQVAAAAEAHPGVAEATIESHATRAVQLHRDLVAREAID